MKLSDLGGYKVADTPKISTAEMNNPFNIKYGPATEDYVKNGKASIGRAGTDGGYFLKFNNRDDGVNAGKGLLFDSPVYKGLTVDQALKKWSNNGYGANVVPSHLASKTIDSLSPEEQTLVLNGMETKGENDAVAPDVKTLRTIGDYKVVQPGAASTAPQKPVLPPATPTPQTPSGAVDTALSTVGKAAGSFLPKAAKATGDFAKETAVQLGGEEIGAGKEVASDLMRTGGAIESVADESLGRVGNILKGKGNVPTGSGGATQKTVAENPLLQQQGAAEKTGGVIAQAGEFLAPESEGAKLPEVIGGVIKGATKALPEAVSKVAQFAGKTAASFGTNTAVGTAQTGDIKKGAEQGLLGEVLGAAGDVVGKVTGRISESAAASKAATYVRKALGASGKKTASNFMKQDTQKLAGLETLYEQSKGVMVKGLDGVEKEFNPAKSNFFENVQALNQSKKNIWSKVESALEKGSSLKADLSTAKNYLKSIVGAEDRRGPAISHAKNLLDEVGKLGTVKQIQSYIQDLNKEGKEAFTGGSDNIRAEISATLAGHMNQALDSSLEKVDSASIRPWKDRYASLKGIEKDMVNQAQKILRKTGQGIPGYLDEFGNLDLVEAAFSHNPAYLVTKGLGMKAIAALNKASKDPERALRNAYKMIEKYGGREAPPAEKPMLSLPAAKGTSRSEVGSGPTLALPKKLQSEVDKASQKAGVDGKKVADFFSSIRQKELATMLPEGKTKVPQTTIPLRGESESTLDKRGQDSAVVKKQIREAIEMAKQDAKRMLRGRGENPIITPPPK